MASDRSSGKAQGRQAETSAVRSKARGEESHEEGKEVLRSEEGQKQREESIGAGRQEVRARFWKALHEAMGRRVWSEGNSSAGPDVGGDPGQAPDKDESGAQGGGARGPGSEKDPTAGRRRGVSKLGGASAGCAGKARQGGSERGARECYRT